MSLADLFHQLSILIGLPAVLLAAVAAALIVIVRDWRLALFSYAVLSVMQALILSHVVPVEWALLQPIIGGMIAVMLFLSARQLQAGRSVRPTWEARWPQMASLTSFRILAVALAAVAFWTLRSGIRLPVVEPLLRDAVVWLALVGLLGVALHEEPLHAGLALLTTLGGCQLLLFSLIQRRMLVGLVEGGQLLLGLAIAYLMLSRNPARPTASAEPSAR